jgi:hypothetical protein
MTTAPRVDYQTHPSQYRHWKLSFDGVVATLRADFDENAGLRPGYKLKLNSPPSTAPVPVVATSWPWPATKSSWWTTAPAQ